MQLWQMDVMGGVLLHDDTELKVVTGVDDRYPGGSRVTESQRWA
jgi:hypothetical protein